MARRNKGSVKSPDSGYKFVCQSCEEDVVQVPCAELVFLWEETARGGLHNTPMQSCIECVEAIKEENGELMAKRAADGQSVISYGSQVRELRDTDTLDALIPEEVRAEKLAASSDSAKIDKLCATVESLVQLMTLQIQSQMIPPPKVKAVVSLTSKKPAPVKRAILAPPKVKAIASKATKPKATQAKKAAKPKPRSRR